MERSDFILLKLVHSIYVGRVVGLLNHINVESNTCTDYQIILLDGLDQVFWSNINLLD